MRATAFVAALVLLIAGVSSAWTSQSVAPAASGACSLLTKEDAATALGETVEGPRKTEVPGGPSSCEYSGSGLHKVHLNVIPLTAATATIYKGMCAQKDKQGLTGLGDVTCWYNDKHAELQVLKGLTFFSIEFSGKGDPTEAIKGVARKVYDRLK
ncbi:MAG TPA: hypothetical protein VKE96_01145 [Vicinamibacterales bacterium]|nr:hypothetical protein [Vicinamibacterales bacterium]